MTGASSFLVADNPGTGKRILTFVSRFLYPKRLVTSQALSFIVRFVIVYPFSLRNGKTRRLLSVLYCSLTIHLVTIHTLSSLLSLILHLNIATFKPSTFRSSTNAYPTYPSSDSHL